MQYRVGTVLKVIGFNLAYSLQFSIGLPSTLISGVLPLDVSIQSLMAAAERVSSRLCRDDEKDIRL